MQFTVGRRNDGFLESNPDDDAGCLSHLPRRGIADNMWLAIPSVATTVRAGLAHHTESLRTTLKHTQCQTANTVSNTVVPHATAGDIQQGLSMAPSSSSLSPSPVRNNAGFDAPSSSGLSNNR